ncbi:hypothetical protein LOTGIDRAFT_157884 [Lottia gigantea]|uniref:Uncharacterized protein n=1 Tax=Lottia gigantea TaxID=225164 RepID=V4ATI2_LOTGI|nr:hypothetical protein LOTGIDRAFT_157884 [Lottia gigantea]ESP00603.1 hypothetical protein LOTGIDRAFT_157884 [Lottia gigantea]
MEKKPGILRWDKIKGSVGDDGQSRKQNGVSGNISGNGTEFPVPVETPTETENHLDRTTRYTASAPTDSLSKDQISNDSGFSAEQKQIQSNEIDSDDTPLHGNSNIVNNEKSAPTETGGTHLHNINKDVTQRLSDYNEKVTNDKVPQMTNGADASNKEIDKFKDNALEWDPLCNDSNQKGETPETGDTTEDAHQTKFTESSESHEKQDEFSRKHERTFRLYKSKYFDINYVPQQGRHDKIRLSPVSAFILGAINSSVKVETLYEKDRIIGYNAL